MFESLSLYSKIENPTLEMVFLTFLLAFICSSIIALTYFYSSPNTLKTTNLIQSIILSAIVVATILQSIGDSIGAGLGILGALTIINFRTNFRDPRDIIFMFAALASGIACGSYVYSIAIIGTLFFCLIAITLKFTPFYTGKHQIWEIKLQYDPTIDNKINLDLLLSKHCKRFSLNTIKNIDKSNLEKTFSILLIDDAKYHEFIKELEINQYLVTRFSKENTGFSDSDF